MPFQIIRNDITKVAVDAIVNSANPNPIYAGAVDRSIYLAAGASELVNCLPNVRRSALLLLAAQHIHPPSIFRQNILFILLDLFGLTENMVKLPLSVPAIQNPWGLQKISDAAASHFP